MTMRPKQKKKSSQTLWKARSRTMQVHSEPAMRNLYRENVCTGISLCVWMMITVRKCEQSLPLWLHHSSRLRILGRLGHTWCTRGELIPTGDFLLCRCKSNKLPSHQPKLLPLTRSRDIKDTMRPQMCNKSSKKDNHVPLDHLNSINQAQRR